MELFEIILKQHSTYLPRRFLARAMELSGAVGRIVIRIPDGDLWYGTGFMISPDLMVTCHHVLDTPDTAGSGELWLDYYEEVDGSFAQPIKLQLAPQTFFATSAELDLSVVAVDKRSAEYSRLGERSYIGVSASPPIIGERVNIIHHPQGEPQQFSINDGQVVDVLENHLHYDASTNQGSAGAPVFNDQWELIAIHHHAVPRNDAIGYVANEGIRAQSFSRWMISVQPDLRGLSS